ncbi:type I restriction endonuclease [Zavarzinia sp. CC-PAN008]|uniref:type I restriction endonuclease n=1 Tax=Zavarzinia sp. CC-PAN008 TaxID=3243332 RepID=UPI003F7462F5
MSFVAELPDRCRSVLKAADRCVSEEATKQFLVLPFLNVLGYNVFDPEEVMPEHHADFSEKYKNRVDYVIVRDGVPIIGIEVKPKGADFSGDRGQLRSYFNACMTVKLGIITNGVRYECYADTDEPNIMDQNAFLTFDLSEIAKGEADSRALNGIEELTKARFDPQNLGTEARRKLLLGQFIGTLDSWQDRPTDALVRLLLDEGGFKGNKTGKVVDDCRDLAKQAINLFVNRLILRRVGVDNVSVAQAIEHAPAPEQSAIPASEGIITTETEIKAYEYVRRRLAFLIKEEELYNEIEHISYVDLKTTFKVYYKRPNAGSLFNLKEKSGGLMVFEFPALSNQIVETHKLSDIDKLLLDSFKIRVGGS